MTETMTLEARFRVDATQAAAELKRIREEMARAREAIGTANETIRLNRQRLSELSGQAQQTTGTTRNLVAEHDRLSRELATAQANADGARRRIAELAEQQRTLAQETARSSAEMGRQQAQAAGSSAALAGKGRAISQMSLGLGRLATDLGLGRTRLDDFASASGGSSQALGALSSVISSGAALLGGPWGIALGAAVGLLGQLALSSRDASDAKADLIEATERLDELTGRLRVSLKDQIAQQVAATSADLARTIAIRQQTIALLENLEAQGRALTLTQSLGGRSDPGAGSIGVAAAVNAVRQANVKREIAEQEQAIAKAGQALVGAQEKLQKLLADETEKAARAGARALTGMSNAAREAARAAAEAQRQHNREIEALLAVVQRVRQVDLLRDGVAADERRRLSLIGGSDVSAFLDRQQSETDRARANDMLSGLVRQAEARLPEVGQRAGERMGRAANDELLRNAAAIGQLIGGKAGDLVSKVASILLGASTGDFRGGGRVGAILQFTNAATDGGTGKLIRKTLVEIFGEKDFDKRLGAVLGNAGIGGMVGGAVGGQSRGSQLGGSIGGAIGGELLSKVAGKLLGSFAGPIGSIVGGLLGGAIGGLFTKVRKGTVTVSGGGGEVSVGAATGNGGAQRQAATGLGSGVGQAIETIIERLGGTAGSFSVSIGQRGKDFVVDPSGAGRTRGAGVRKFGQDQSAAVQAALADAIRDGAVAGVSPQVQAALRRYADNVDRAVAEAMKVQNLERLLADRQNPFTSAFQDFERQARERLKIARDYGFDLIEIEKVNAEQRGKLLNDKLQEFTGSARALLDDFRFGGRAEGSISERLAALGAERSRLTGLVEAGDLSQIDALTDVIQKQVDLSRQAFGTTQPFAADRAGAISQLESLIRQTESRINEASLAAQTQTVSKLAELNTTADEQVLIQQRILAAVQQLGLAGGGFGGLAFDAAAFQRAMV
ncbi:MAG: hypothetical protein ACK4Z0_08935 [Sphingomonadaceae bacterium]